MLESCVNQGAGLQHIASQAGPRVIAMASHGEQQGELPLLWSLCSTLVDSGYPVVVLDATTSESTDNPGLEQLLDGVYWRNDEIGATMSWTVLPASRGLQMIQASRSNHRLPLDPLSGLLENFGVIVIYARAELLVRLLPGSGIEPLLTVSPVKMSSVTAYQALKKMLLNAGLRPTVANIVLDPLTNTPMASQSPVNKLQECAMEFLGYRPEALNIRARPSEGRASDDVNRLALRLLENAMPLHRPQFARSH